MRRVRGIALKEGTREELLPDFDPAFPYLATCAELDRYAEPGTPWHWHRPVELFYMESGTLEYTTPHERYIFPAGTGGFVNSNVLHTTAVVPSGRETLQHLHLFDPALLSGAPGSLLERKYILPLTAAGPELIPLSPQDPAQAALLARIREAFALPREPGWEFALREALAGIWVGLLALAPEQPRPGADADRRVKALLGYLHQHYAEDLTVEALAAAAHISRRACFRLFREHLHTTPADYLREYRLRQACRMLAHTDEPITAIGYACGLGSGSYFGSRFRRRFGCTPSQYRAKWHDPDNSAQK